MIKRNFVIFFPDSEDAYLKAYAIDAFGDYYEFTKHNSLAAKFTENEVSFILKQIKEKNNCPNSSEPEVRKYD